MNKKLLIGLGVGFAIIVIAIISFRAIRSFGGSEEIVPTPTPTPAYLEVDESVQAELDANAARTKVTLKITGLDEKYTGIQYELTYMTDNGPKGALSGSKPISISGKKEFERDVELGTCSTGGKCTYDKGVRDFNIFVKFSTQDGTVYVLRKKIDEV